MIVVKRNVVLHCYINLCDGSSGMFHMAEQLGGGFNAYFRYRNGRKYIAFVVTLEGLCNQIILHLKDMHDRKTVFVY